VGATVAQSLGLEYADVVIEIVSMEQEVLQTISLPGELSTYSGEGALAQLKTGLVAYLNSQLDANADPIGEADVTISVRSAADETGRRLQSGGGVAVDYTVVATSSIESAFTQPDFVSSFVAAVNTQGGSLQLDPVEVVAQEPVVQTEVIFNVVVAEEQAVEVASMETAITGITRNLELELGAGPDGSSDDTAPENPGRGRSTAASAGSAVTDESDGSAAIITAAVAAGGAVACLVLAKMLLCRGDDGSRTMDTKKASAYQVESATLSKQQPAPLKSPTRLQP
jgi:hypothetical protein